MIYSGSSNELRDIDQKFYTNLLELFPLNLKINFLSYVMRSRKVMIIVLVVGLSFFVYSQYVSVSQISAIITRNQPVEDGQESMHDIDLEFNNPSLLVLSAGETKFLIISEEKIIGSGDLAAICSSPIR